MSTTREQYSQLLVKLAEIGWDEVRTDPERSKVYASVRGHLVEVDTPVMELVSLFEKALAYEALGARMDQVLARLGKI